MDDDGFEMEEQQIVATILAGLCVQLENRIERARGIVLA